MTIPLPPDADPLLAALVLELDAQRERMAAVEATAARAETAMAQLATTVQEALDAIGEEQENQRGYRPAPPPRWWELDGEDRRREIARVTDWVDTVLIPGYGRVVRVPPCWRDHDLCLYVFDLLAELHKVLYLPRRRSARDLSAAAEWHARLLLALADLVQRETGNCIEDTCILHPEILAGASTVNGSRANGSRP